MGKGFTTRNIRVVPQNKSATSLALRPSDSPYFVPLASLRSPTKDQKKAFEALRTFSYGARVALGLREDSDTGSAAPHHKAPATTHLVPERRLGPQGDRRHATQSRDQLQEQAKLVSHLLHVKAVQLRSVCDCLAQRESEYANLVRFTQRILRQNAQLRGASPPNIVGDENFERDGQRPSRFYADGGAVETYPSAPLSSQHLSATTNRQLLDEVQMMQERLALLKCQMDNISERRNSPHINGGPLSPESTIIDGHGLLPPPALGGPLSLSPQQSSPPSVGRRSSIGVEEVPASIKEVRQSSRHRPKKLPGSANTEVLSADGGRNIPRIPHPTPPPLTARPVTAASSLAGSVKKHSQGANIVNPTAPPVRVVTDGVPVVGRAAIAIRPPSTETI